MLRWSLGIIVIVAAAAAAAWWWFNRPLVIRHPDFGTDCRQLVDAARLDAKVDCINVWYGTNRKLLTADATLTREITDVTEGLGESGDQLRLGQADVWLPKLIEDGGDREIGETPHVQGAAPRDSEKLADYVFLTRITTSGRETFTSTLQSAIDQRNGPFAARGSSILLFVHGFNVEFDEALVRAAQLSNDLSRNDSFDVGAPVLFSWPSAGALSLEDYQGDRARSLGAAPYLEEFLDILTTDLDVSRINIIAHSMGNRVLTKALEDYASDYLERHERDDLEFRILLVAADVERDIFDAANGVFDNLDANVTIYTSDTDRALHASNLLNQKKRLGDTDTNRPYIRAAQNYQTIDATDVTTQLFGIGHNYYSDNPTILWDMMCTIGETRPQDRALEIARFGGLPDGEQYFRVNAELTPIAEACTLHRTAFPASSRVAREAETPDDTVVPDEASPPPSTRRLEPPEPPAAATLPEPMLDTQVASTRTVFYVDDYDSLDLAPYVSVLEQVLARDAEIIELTIRAHTDTVGSEEENRARSQRFAAAVADWFEDRGVATERIIALGLGETELFVDTGDEVEETFNRRVEIEVVYAN